MMRIKISSKKYPDKCALVSASDFKLVNSLKWFMAERFGIFYAVANIDGKLVKMHRFILGLGAKKPIVDHINGDGLNNTRDNLRVSNFKLNGANRTKRKSKTSKYKGVYHYATNCKSRPWVAVLYKDGKQIFRQHCATEVDAALMYNTHASKHFGEHARLNSVEEQN